MAFRDTINLWLGLGVLGLALLAYFVIIPAGVDPPGNVPIRALAPDFWPNTVMAFMAIIGAVIALQGWFERKPVGPAKGSMSPGALLRSGIAIALLFGYYGLLQSIGFIAASIIAMLAFMLLAGERRYIRAISIAFVLPILLYYFFTHVASVAIPLGLFEDWP